MKVVLDTSAIYPDFYFRNADSRLLLDSIGTVVTSVLVPEVVVRETINKHREVLAEAFDAHQKLLRTLTQISDKAPERLLRAGDLGETRAAYEVFLIALLKQPGWQRLPIPHATHEQVLSRELSRQKPFSTKGTGYRDYLIWLSLLDFAKTESGPLHFITGNTRDFSDGHAFHEDLLSDLRSIRAEKRVRLHSSIRAFVENSILPTLEHDDRVKRELDRGSLREFNLHAWFRANEDELVRPEDVSGAGLGTGWEGFHSHFVEPPEVLSVTADEVRTLNSGDTLVHGAAKVRAALSISSWASDFDHREVRDFWQTASGDVSMNAECEVEIRFAVVLEKATNKAILGELVAVTGDATELTYVNPLIPKG